MLLARSVQAQTDPELEIRSDQFQLWTDCQPVELLVERLIPEATQIGLTMGASKNNLPI